MNELKTFIKNNRLLFIALAIFLCVGIWFSFGAGSRTHDSGSGVHDNGERADEVRTELDTAIRNEQQAVDDLRTAEDTASELGSAVEAGRREVQSAIQSNEELGEGNARAAELIRDCQEILRTVRQRGTIEER